MFSTVGFGEITPVADAARVTTMIQMLGDLLVVGLVLRVVLGAVKGGRERRADGSTGFAESSDQGDAGQVARSYVAKQGSRGPDREVI